MVKYTVKESTTLSQLRELRQAGSLCDVTLTVGQDDLRAHRNVLAVGSRYFNTLFLGQFIDSSKQNIDLSEVASDVKDLELVIDFLYTGEVDINAFNLEVLAKLSTFLQVENLRKFCVEYIGDELNLWTCLRYCLFANSCGLTEIEKVAKLYLTSRFHDSYKDILGENLELSPDNVSFLLTNDVFKHCTVSSILYFIFKWLTDVITDQHAKVANQILDSVDDRNVLPADGRLSKRYKTKGLKVLAKLKETYQNSKSPDVEKLLEKFQRALWKFCPELEIEGDGASASSAKKHKGTTQSSSRNQLSEKEAVVVTISPTWDIRESDLKEAHEIIGERTGPVFTLYCYTPRSKTWYRVTHFGSVRISDPILEDFCISDVSSTLFKEELVLMLKYKYRKVYFYNLRTRAWKVTILPGSDIFGSNLQDDEAGEVDKECIVSGNDNLYLILSVLVFNNRTGREYPTGVFFVGLKLDDYTWRPFFETSIERDCECAHPTLKAKVSSISKELIFTRGPSVSVGTCLVFMVNLNDEVRVPVKVHKGIIDMCCDKYSFSILLSHSHFHVLYNRIRECSTLNVYKHKLNCLGLAREWIGHRDFAEINKIQHGAMYSSPCTNQLEDSSDKSFWFLEGDEHSMSFMHEIELSQDGDKLEQREHTPPPISCIGAMAVGELPRDLLDQMTHSPVQEFFHRYREVERVRTAEIDCTLRRLRHVLLAMKDSS